MEKIERIIKESFETVLSEKQSDSCEPLLEMARIDEPSIDSTILGTKEVWIYGNDRSSMSPHFHYIDKRGENKFEVEIRIDDLSICRSTPRSGLPPKRLLTWEGIVDAQKKLLKWLESPNADVPSETNYKMLKVAWNQNNRNNPVTL